jgi:hypothetical protein
MAAMARFVESLVGAVAAPPGGLPAIAGLVVWALATTVAALLVMKWTSDQRRLEAERRQLQAGLFELRLFSHDLRTVAMAAIDLVRHTLIYARLSLPPLLWLAAPMTLLLVQLHARYGYAGLVPGQAAVLTARVSAGVVRQSGGRPAFALRAPDAVRIEAGPVWAPTLREVSWRIAAVRPGDYELTVTAGGASEAKRLAVGDAAGPRTPVRAQGPSAARLLAPGESPIPVGTGIESIRVGYPPGRMAVAGLELPWLVPFAASCLICALLLAKRLRVVW